MFCVLWFFFQRGIILFFLLFCFVVYPEPFFLLCTNGERSWNALLRLERRTHIHASTREYRERVSREIERRESIEREYRERDRSEISREPRSSASDEFVSEWVGGWVGE